MDVKQQMAQHAREFYHQPISPYELILARIEKSDFSLYQIYSDDMPGKVLDFNYGGNFLFAYQIPEHVLIKENLPPLTEEELKEAAQPVVKPKNFNIIDSDDEEENKYSNIEEEIKGEEPPSQKDTTTSRQKLKPIDLKHLIKPDWLMVPVRPVARQAKQNVYYYSSNYYQNKFENKDGIPRLFWFHKDMSLFDVNKFIVTQYSFAQAYDDLPSHDPEVYFNEHYKGLIDYLNDPEKQDAPLETGVFEQDST